MFDISINILSIFFYIINYMKDKTIMLSFKDRFLIKKIDTIYHLYNLVDNMKYNTYDNINDLFKYLKKLITSVTKN